MAKLIGITSATRFPNKDPVEISSPTIIKIPLIAKKIDDDPIKETFLLSKKIQKLLKT